MRRNFFGLIGLQFILIPLICSSLYAEGRFTDNRDGTITDHQLNLMWAKHDNYGDITWHQAEKWIKYTFPTTLPTLYDNWRLPTLDELKSLYAGDSAGGSYEAECGKKVSIARPFKLTCSFIWSGDRQAVTARVFNFQRGTFYSDRLVHNRGYRALAVRNIE